MEPRIVLTADPVVAGITYLEADIGQDITPDHFQVTFQGGSDTTQLTQFVINGDQDGNGVVSNGDMLFHAGPEFPGAGGYHPFQFDAATSQGITADDILSWHVSENGLVLTVEVRNFFAGDVLGFTIDVDEVEGIHIDQIASAVEFEGTLFTATFEDQHFTFVDRSVSVDVNLPLGSVQTQTEGVFYSYYDKLLDKAEELTGETLDLMRDNATGQSDRTAGAIDAYDLVPKPVTISGTVYEDANLNWQQDSNETGIAGVQINLQLLNEANGTFQTVASTTTDAQGNYLFGTALNLLPGTYRLVQVQPDGYLDVGALAGTVAGNASGQVLSDQQGFDNIITDIHIPLGNTAATDYDFKEVRPASISGFVYHDRNDDGIRDPGEEGLVNVLIQVTRVGSTDGATYDPFENAPPIFVRTDNNGFYQVDGLPPGIYEVVEINSYPPGENPLAGFIDGKDTVGRVGNQTNGTAGNDQFTMIDLRAGDAGIEYNFGELRPSSISGYVSISTPDGNCLDPSDPNHSGIAGVTIQLFDASGQLVDQTITNANGFYEFADLNPGTYSVVQVQPNGFLDGPEHLGNVNGVSSGLILSNDHFAGITLTSDSSGSMYNFCEHLPASIHGTVYHDLNDNGFLEAGEQGLGGVTVELLDEQGQLISSTTTNAQGNYWFSGLSAGTYSVREIQPLTFVDGKDSVGTVNGVVVGQLQPDLFTNITLKYGDVGVEYNFGEIRYAQISGRVHGDANGDCHFEPSEGDVPLEGVVLRLFNSDRQMIAQTTTDANGNYVFDGLRPGEYMIRQFTPDGLIDGGERVGTVNGVANGRLHDDRISRIILQSGDSGINYDFCEHLPAEIHGHVFHDLNNDGIFGPGERGIPGTQVQLFNAAGELVSEMTTDANGAYWFTGLIAGTYKIQEIQPDGFVDGKDRVGRVDGVVTGQAMDDMFVNIVIRGGQKGLGYDFGELRLASISGFVHTDMNGNCILEPAEGEHPLAGVTLELLDANGQVLATTLTSEAGFYEFAGLLPGEYSIRQQQPIEYFDGRAVAGDNGGDVNVANIISGIRIESGQRLQQYNFCEHPAAEIHGRVFIDGPAFQTEDGRVPDNYRDLRDGVYQVGIDTPIAGVRMFLYHFNLPEGDQLVTRPVTLADVLPGIYTNLGSNDPSTPISVLTDENGEYWFTGLRAGNYLVLQEQPEGVVDANDIPGTTTGNAINSASDSVPQSLLQFSTEQRMDAIFGISVAVGQASLQNNFTEVTVLTNPTGPVIFPPLDPTPRLSNPITPTPGITGFPGLFGALPISTTELIGTSRTVSYQAQTQGTGDAHTWHLSIVNGGQPRSDSDVSPPNESIWKQASFIADGDWQRFDMNAGTWIFTETKNVGDIVINNQTAIFGTIGGIPLAGDFNGDGKDQLAFFQDGYWLIDLNGNGRWDEADLMATLGDRHDRPVVGDWDGDGKDDIGIYGPIWDRDPEAIARDPGLPNPANDPHTRPKNVPPVREEATNGARVMKLTSFGRQRVDVIDHVFGIGDEQDTPITGDWNGNGIRSIGYFNAGKWQFDMNGDGRFDYQDATADFGQAGDIPLVGDFNGDGIDQIAVYRAGTWIIDSNGNREIDAADTVFQLGGPDDIPVVGDWDGDGIDEPAIYRPGASKVF